MTTLTRADADKIASGSLTLADICRLEDDPDTQDVGYHLRVQFHSINPNARHPIVQAAIDAVAQ